MEDNYSSTSPAPHSLPAEMSVLGSMLLDNDAMELAMELLIADDFYDPANQEIFKCICSLRGSGAPVDAVSLVAELDRVGKLIMVGDASYIADITTKTPSAANVEHYISIVSDRSIQRQLIRAGNSITRDGMNSALDIENSLGEAERRIFDISLKKAADTLLPVQDTMYDVFEQLGELMKLKNRIVGVPTGFRVLDYKLSGLKKSDLIIVAGRPAMGKTSFSLNMAQYAALHAGRTVVVFSLEMSREQLIMRLFSSESKIDMQRMLTGTINEDELVVVAQSLEPLGKSKLFIDDSAMATVPEIRSKCRRLKVRYGLDLIVIDYLQLMRSTRKSDNRQQEISEITRSLKVLARELDVPILLLSQLSRAPEQRRDDHRPVLSDLRESGAIEQDADIVLLLYRDQVYNEESDSVAEVIVAKHRNGPTGTVKLNWIGEYTSFADLPLGYEEKNPQY